MNKIVLFALLLALAVNIVSSAAPECSEPPQQQGVVDPVSLPGVQTKPAWCRAYFRSWSFEAGECKEWVYGGCGGNGNRFYTKEACDKACL